MTTGYLLFLRVEVTPRYTAAILPTMILLGIGFSLAFSAPNVQATSKIADEEQGPAGGLLQTSGQLGGAIALVSVTAVITAAGTHHAATATQALAAFQPGLVLISIVGGLGLVTAGTGLRRSRATTPTRTSRRLPRTRNSSRLTNPLRNPADLLPPATAWIRSGPHSGGYAIVGDSVVGIDATPDVNAN